jgi:hypothetical protein
MCTIVNVIDKHRPGGSKFKVVQPCGGGGGGGRRGGRVHAWSVGAIKGWMNFFSAASYFKKELTLIIRSVFLTVNTCILQKISNSCLLRHILLC